MWKVECVEPWEEGEKGGGSEVGKKSLTLYRSVDHYAIIS